MTPDSVISIINSAGVVGLLVLIIFAVIWGLQKRWWVPGWVYDQSQKDNEALQKITESYGDKLERILNLLERQQESTRPVRRQ